jgi:outer membrane protein
MTYIKKAIYSKGLILLTIIIISFGVSSLYQYLFAIKIRYVDSAILVNKYKGMEEAHQEYQKQIKPMEFTLDSLKEDLDRSILQYNENRTKMSSVELKNAQEKINILQSRNYNYSERIKQTMSEIDNNLTQAVLNQINTFIKDYADKQGYDLILGTTSDGGLLYAKKKLNITDDVVDALNADYLK